MTLRATCIWVPLTIAACLSATPAAPASAAPARKAAPAPAASKGRPAPRAQKFDPCALLRPAEIEAVQGEKPVDAKSDRPQRGEFEVWQCFFTLPTFAKSISLEVTRKDPSRPDAASPLAHWQTMFHETEESAGEVEEAGEESGPPVAVEGVGDEAFWSGNGVVGALYVLKGDAYLRLSIGGSEDDSEKLQKSKTLASKALKRL